MDLLQCDVRGCLAGAIGGHGITEAEWADVAVQVAQAQSQLLARRARGDLGFADLPFDATQLGAIMPLAKRVRYQCDHLLVLGIGGSALGLRAMAEALLAPASALQRPALRPFPELVVCDNIDPDTFGAVLQRLDWKKTCVNVVSKSGRTAETAAQFLIVRELLQRACGPQRWKENVVVTTDRAQGPLRALVIAEGMTALEIPANVGGRFSCLSPVALFPAACVGIDVAGLLAGARAMAEHCMPATAGEQAPFAENVAAQLAAAHYLLDTRHGQSIAVFMPYLDALQRFGDWYVQLVAESLGKNGKGLTPLRAVGATDQHAQLQLFVDGPRDKVVTVLTARQFGTRLPIPASQVDEYAWLGGHDLGALLNAEAAATRQALREAQRPVIHLEVGQLNARTLGQLFFCYEWMVALAGELYGIDAFNQPGVERGKQLARERLS